MDAVTKIPEQSFFLSTFRSLFFFLFFFLTLSVLPSFSLFKFFHFLKNFFFYIFSHFFFVFVVEAFLHLLPSALGTTRL